jgi:hypothetical protein
MSGKKSGTNIGDSADKGKLTTKEQVQVVYDSASRMIRDFHPFLAACIRNQDCAARLERMLEGENTACTTVYFSPLAAVMADRKLSRRLDAILRDSQSFEDLIRDLANNCNYIGWDENINDVLHQVQQLCDVFRGTAKLLQRGDNGMPPRDNRAA